MKQYSNLIETLSSQGYYKINGLRFISFFYKIKLFSQNKFIVKVKILHCICYDTLREFCKLFLNLISKFISKCNIIYVYSIHPSFKSVFGQLINSFVIVYLLLFNNNPTDESHAFCHTLKSSSAAYITIRTIYFTYNR